MTENIMLNPIVIYTTLIFIIIRIILYIINYIAYKLKTRTTSNEND